MFAKIIEKSNDEQEYPCLMKSRIEEIVVLFTAYSNGVVVSANHKYYDIGYTSDEWTMNVFELFTGKLELSNEEI